MNIPRTIRIAFLALTIAAALACAPAAGAAGILDHWVDKVADAGYTEQTAAGEVCPFATRISWHRLQGSNIVYADGTWKTGYSFMVRFENLDTGKVRMLHESGTLKVTPITDTIAQSRSTGHMLLIFAAGDLGAGSPSQYMWSTGTMTETDVTGGPGANVWGYQILSFATTGKTENLCQTMA